MVIASERSISSAALTCLGTRNGHGVSREAVILRQAIQRQEIRCNKKLRKRRKSVILAASAAPLDAASLQPQRLARVRRAKAGRRRNHPHFMLATSDGKKYYDSLLASASNCKITGAYVAFEYLTRFYYDTFSFTTVKALCQVCRSR